MNEGWSALTALLVTLFAFSFGASMGADVIRRDCINGNTVRLDGKLYRAHCVPEQENTDE